MRPLWMPKTQIWKGEPCYIIGGGPSLEGFDWELLRGKNVLGCNAAFYLGADIVPIIVFGDGAFLQQHRSGLDNYAKDGGTIITCSRLTRRFDPPEYLKIIKKINRGLGVDALGWNGNTGASAINLALLFGANIIYLLGYDMKLSSEGKKNFHNAYSDSPNAMAYGRFLRGMNEVAKDLPVVFPGCSVINLEDDTSALEVFPKESLKEHFSRELVS